MTAASKVALVTGGGRGVGAGIAVGLAEAGWTVHISGRHPARLAETVARIERAGGAGVAHRCDHADDDAIRDLVATAHGAAVRLDLLVNNVWAGPPMNREQPERFWERPTSDWEQLIGIGLRAHFIALHAAAPLLVAQGSGLIVNVSSVGTRAYLHSMLYGMAKAGLDKMTHDAAPELREFGVTVLSLWPGLVRTAKLLASGVESIAGVSVDHAESPELQGRVLAAAAGDLDLHLHTGKVLITAEAAEKYRIFEPNGAAAPISPRVMFGGGGVFPPLPRRRD